MIRRLIWRVFLNIHDCLWEQRMEIDVAMLKL
jgi:hypothetical protein